MVTFNVSPTTLREKAKLIRTLLDESKSTHQQLWSQISTQAGMLPRDVLAAHNDINEPWNNATNDHYEHHHQLASNMGVAADAYGKGDQNVKQLFDTF